MAERFTTTLLKDPTVNATGLPVPPEVVAALGKGRNPKVIVTLNGYTYHGTVQVSNGLFMLSLSAEKREAAGLQPGDQVEVTLELDTEPRTVEVPEDLREALSARPGANEAFEALAYSRRKEFVRQVEEARAPETRSRRISKIVSQLGRSE